MCNLSGNWKLIWISAFFYNGVHGLKRIFFLKKPSSCSSLNNLEANRGHGRHHWCKETYISNYNDSLPFIDSCLVVYRFIRRRIEWLLLWQYGFIWLTLSTIQVGVKTFFELLLYHNSFIYNICDRILKKLHVIYHMHVICIHALLN